MNEHPALPRARPAPRRLLLLALLIGAAAHAAPPEPIDSRLAAKRIDRARPSAAPVTAQLNRIPDAATDPSLGREADRSTEARLALRWLQLRRDVRGSSIDVEEQRIGRFTRYFPHGRFFRMVASGAGEERVGYGSLTMGQLLVLPEEMNLLLALENRSLNRHNVRQLCEIVVRMVEPEGLISMHVIRNAVHRDRSGEIDEVILESWSYGSRQKKRWTFGIQGSAFYSLEEKQISYRPGVADALRPLDVDPTTVGPYGIELYEDEIEGPAGGHERYIAFWRDPALRRKMQEVRAEWLRDNREREQR